MFDVISPSDPEGETVRTTDASLQRSRGMLDLGFSVRDGVTYAARTFQQGALKVRFPNVARKQAPEAVMINTAGGIAGGDRLDMRLRADARASVVVSSQACEKIYRSLSDAAVVSVHIALNEGSHVSWLPQPMIFFDRARLKRETHVTMEADATWLSVEGIVFGRAAMGESVATGLLDDACFIRRGGRLIHVDRFSVAGDIATALARGAVLYGACAMATTRYVAPDAMARIDEMRGLLEGSACPAAVSAWDGMMVMRHVADDSYTLNKELMRVISAFRKKAMPRVWSI
ncbi:MAG: urease accessory protein UreD [Parvibaculaceae bacterium]